MAHRVRIGGQTFAALALPNYRLYFGGQMVSLVGTWMQRTAQAWLVLVLTHSATDLGVVVALQTLPILLVGPYGGVVADRVDKRRFMVVLQALMGVQAAVLAALTLTGVVRYWQVGALAVVLGLTTCFEMPSRQAFVLEMVGTGQVRNAVTLNSTLANAARAIGPAIAGIMIASVGEGWCFVLNAVSFAAVVASLVMMDRDALQPSPPSRRGRGQLREGLRYVARTPALAVPLAMMGLVGCLAYEFQVTLPAAAQRTFHGGAEAYGFMTAAMGAGAVVGGLVTAARGRTGLRPLVVAATAFGVVIALAALSPGLVWELGALALVGAGSVAFLSMGNSTLQLEADPSLRGRVMALWSVAFLGSTPIGGPLLGWITGAASPRVGLGVGALACFLAALVGLASLHRRGRQRSPARVADGGAEAVAAAPAQAVAAATVVPESAEAAVEVEPGSAGGG